MIEDLRRLESGSDLEADVCIVGAGPAGIAIAREFFGTSTKVLLLESGGRRPSSATEPLNDGDAVGISHASLTSGRGRVFGGASTMWGGQCLRPESSTLGRRTWVPNSGWPFALTELDPYFSRAESFFDIDGEVYDERVWDSFGIEPPPVDPERFVHRFSVWCPRPHMGRLYEQQLARSPNVTLLLHATTTEVMASDGGARFSSLRISTPEGKTATVRGRACVLSAGGIENPRLLLASRDTRPQGIGNDHDVVGRYFQDHPNCHSAVLRDGHGPSLQTLYGLLYRRRIRYLPRIVMTAELERSEGVLGCAAHPVFDFGEGSGVEAARRLYRSARGAPRSGRLAADVRRALLDAPRLASIAYRRMAHGRSAHVPPARSTLQVYIEQAPNPDSRVTLSPRRDRFGVPLPKVDWRLTELDRRTVRTMTSRVASEFHRLGLGTATVEPWLDDEDWATQMTDSFHHMGTTRLGVDPRNSVVDPSCQVHGVAGLFVAGSSVFPVAGYVNPTLMIAALAIRLADRLKTIPGAR